MNTPRIVQLSMTINKSIETIEKHLSARGCPFPAFGVNGTTGLPDELSAAQDAVLDATSELHDLLLPPINLLQTKANHIDIVSMQAILRFGIARSFSADEQVSFTTLSKKCGVEESILKRLLRHAITMRVFCEPTSGILAHTNASILLAESNTHDWMSMGCEDMWPAATKTVDAIAKWPEAQEPNCTGFSLVNNTTKSLYETIGSDPNRAERMAGAMKAFTASPGYDVSHVLTLFDWQAIGNGTIVDIGGNKGHVAIALASRFKNLTIVVQDMGSVIEGAASALPAELAPRVRFMEHDLFSEQPIHGADIYYLRWIFHNWSDKYGIQILQNLIPALKPGARVLIQETCLPEPGETAAWKEKHLRSADLTMLSTFNGKERDVDDWKQLFEKADDRFNFLGVKHGKGSALSFIEASWKVGNA